jgi:mRNA interferase RelE/StbE
MALNILGKELNSIPKTDLQRVINRIDLLKEDPRLPVCEKLCGQDLYRVRQGNYRIVYSNQDDVFTVWIVKICHRRNVYR